MCSVLVLERFWRLRLGRFAVVGLSGVIVNLSALAVLAEAFDVEDTLSSATAIELSILWNFLLNNAWTFRDKNADARAGFLRRLLYYNAISLVGLAIQLAAFVGLNRVFVRALSIPEPGLLKYPSQLVGIGLAMTWNFLSNLHLTWAPDSRPAGRAAERRGPLQPGADRGERAAVEPGP